jgi:hypothetical protein
VREAGGTPEAETPRMSPGGRFRDLHQGYAPGMAPTQNTTAPVEPGEPKDPGLPGGPIDPPDPEVVPSSPPEGPGTVPSPTEPETEPAPREP